MSVRDCFPKTYQLGASLQVIDHIGSGGNAAVVHGFLDGETPQERALKLLDPREVNADDMERDFRIFEHPNLVRVEELLNLSDLGFMHVPDWYRTILNCESKPFVKHPIASCSPNPAGWQRRSTQRAILTHLNVTQRTNDKTLAEFGAAEFSILVMEYFQMPLSEHILRHSRSMKEVHRILTGVCAGLTAMHNEGISHSDLVIDNVLVTNEGVAKVIDFGLSESLDEVGIRGDIMLLGLLAFELATGKNLLDYDLMDEDEDINNSNVPTNFVAICKKAVGNDTGSFRTVSDFLEALNKIG